MTPMPEAIDRRLSVAPMMDCTDRHCRYLLRLISRRTLLYSEMVPAGAVLHGDRARLLDFHPAERPLALQLGGADPRELAAAARIAEAHGYDEVNLNVGCPSGRVQNARFGACLMAEPELVADCVAAMRSAVAIPVTVKTRIGIDRRDSYEALRSFVDTVAAAGCRSFALHARKAWLRGLSPKRNREVPPLRYDVVRRLKGERPELEVMLNGGVATLDEAEAELARGLDGVMLGRAAYHAPYVLAEADRRVFGEATAAPSREGVVGALAAYAEAQVRCGVPVYAVARHALGLFAGLPGSRAWRRSLSRAAREPAAGAELIREALAARESAAVRAEAMAAARATPAARCLVAATTADRHARFAPAQVAVD